MKHFLSYVEEAIKDNWNKPAITNYGANTLNYSDVAVNISKLHIIFEQCGIKKGDHIAICAKSSAEWCVAFLAIASYEAVAVPLLSDFLPENVLNLTKASDSKLLFVDNSVLAGMQRDGVVDGFADVDGFIAIVDIVTFSAIDGYGGKFNVEQEVVDKLF
ncbi:MAG: AMP-binding protein, partial [Bacteroidaceae bacterium]|nr:AMP-binding protein [Bacteroidaceae bacterium]